MKNNVMCHVVIQYNLGKNIHFENLAHYFKVQQL